MSAQEGGGRSHPDWALRLEKKPGSLVSAFDLMDGKLHVAVFRHQVSIGGRGRTCLTYLTDGFRALRQKEILFTLTVLETAVQLPEEPIRFYNSVFPYAQKGTTVDEGGLTELGAGKFMGFSALTYIRAESFKEFSVPRPALAAVPLTDEELEAFKAFGSLRVVSRLGKLYGYYPGPFWIDPARPALPMGKVLEVSVLNKFPHLAVRRNGVSATVEPDRAVLRLPRSAVETFQKALAGASETMPLVVFPDLDSEADGCLTWEPGEPPTAITPGESSGRRLSACFVAFVLGKGADEASVAEDGILVSLTEKSWKDFRDALVNGNGFSFPKTAEGQGFDLRWIRETYENPVDGLCYSSAGGWKGYSPEGGVEEESGPARLKEIVLLVEQDKFAARVELDAFNAYVAKLRESVRDFFSKVQAGAGADLMVQIELFPGDDGHFLMSGRGDVSSECRGALPDILRRVQAPAIRGGRVSFQMIFALWGGYAGS